MGKLNFCGYLIISRFYLRNSWKFDAHKSVFYSISSPVAVCIFHTRRIILRVCIIRSSNHSHVVTSHFLSSLAVFHCHATQAWHQLLHTFPLIWREASLAASQITTTRKPSCRWQTRATLAKSLHSLRKSSGVVSCIARFPIDSVPMVSYYVLYSNCVCKMRRFGDTRLLKLPCPWNPGQGSLKVIESDTIR